MSTPSGVELIAEERRRQVDEWGDRHDDTVHSEGELAQVAAAYAWGSAAQYYRPDAADRKREQARSMSPWKGSFFRPKTPLRDLVRAGALIAAEIDRRIRNGESIDG